MHHHKHLPHATSFIVLLTPFFPSFLTSGNYWFVLHIYNFVISKCYINGIMQYVAFWGLMPLSSIQVGCISNLFLLLLSNILCMDVFHSLTICFWWTFWLFPVFGYYKSHMNKGAQIFKYEIFLKTLEINTSNNKFSSIISSLVLNINLKWQV